MVTSCQRISNGHLVTQDLIKVKNPESSQIYPNQAIWQRSRILKVQKVFALRALRANEVRDSFTAKIEDMKSGGSENG